MKVLVTGASGFLGSHIAEQLVREGHEVRCLVRKSSKVDLLKKLGVELAHGAVDLPESLPEATRGVDAVIHSAGLVKARTRAEFDAVNHQGTRALLDAALATAPGLRRFVLISSLAAHGPAENGVPRACDADPAPVTEYGRSKAAAERAAREYVDRLPITVLRPPAIYGPRDTEMFAFFQMVRSRVVVRMGAGSETLSIIYGPDAAAAAVRALAADVPSGSAYFIDDGRHWKYEELVRALEAALGVRVLVRTQLPMPVVRAAAALAEHYGRLRDIPMMFTRDKCNELEVPHWVCDSTPARRDLGWVPAVTFDEGARRTAQWYREHRWL